MCYIMVFCPFIVACIDSIHQYKPYYCMFSSSASIGRIVSDSAAVKLKCEGDMSFFYAEQLVGVDGLTNVV